MQYVLRFPLLFVCFGGADRGVDQQGTLVASGTPERVIRLWDPRVAVQGGKSSAGQLVGHTDNVKALVMSEDGRYVSPETVSVVVDRR
jgi:hypothetical protein